MEKIKLALLSFCTLLFALLVLFLFMIQGNIMKLSDNIRSLETGISAFDNSRSFDDEKNNKELMIHLDKLEEAIKGK